LHGPSLKRYLSGHDLYLELSADDVGVKALSFAVFYAAIMTLHPEECLAQFNVEKHSALRRNRFACEVLLAQADLHRTNEIVVLQAFIIYLVGNIQSGSPEESAAVVLLSDILYSIHALLQRITTNIYCTDSIKS